MESGGRGGGIGDEGRRSERREEGRIGCVGKVWEKGRGGGGETTGQDRKTKIVDERTRRTR